ncbi:hypothetical protein ABZ770_39975 [Streptomyces sp. NPDC006654]|uniref:hypothetical protein n=1 Tax=Streptomyces sp. NPDC006654 TaxID=3156897 RepID=UPI0033C91646
MGPAGSPRGYGIAHVRAPRQGAAAAAGGEVAVLLARLPARPSAGERTVQWAGRGTAVVA